MSNATSINTTTGSSSAILASAVVRPSMFLEIQNRRGEPRGKVRGGSMGFIPSVVSRTPSESVADARRGNVEQDRPSSFDISLIPKDFIQKRELTPYSVHYSISTASWIATIVRSGVDGDEGSGKRCTAFQFPTEREARMFARVYSPPKMKSGTTRCVCCSAEFNDPTGSVVNNNGANIGGIGNISTNTVTNTSAMTSSNSKPKSCLSYHCKNCGAQICDKCSRRWGIRMVPRTYVVAASLTVRVCKSCDWLSNAFCMALLQGRYENALEIHGTGNVNLRCTFADIHKEAMFPIHCAVMGGNLELVKWLVQVQDCPIAVRKDFKSGMLLSIQTSKRRTLVDLAMTGKPKIDVLGFLIRKNLNVLDTKDPSLAPKTLQTLMSAEYRFEPNGNEVKSNSDLESMILSHPSDCSATTTLEDTCVICCERQMDCVLNPCGHQICCLDCGSHLTRCPICKKQCNVLKIFRL